MGFLRTNFTRTGGQPLTAIGGGFYKGSWGGGAGNALPFGGFICGSGKSSDVVSANPGMAFSATEAMGSYFGANVYGGGYQIQVVGLQLPLASVSNMVGWTTSLSGSVTYIKIGGSAAAFIVSSYSLYVIWTGFIVSSP